MAFYSLQAPSTPELHLLTERAHEEAFVHMGPGGQMHPAQWGLASESLQARAQDQDLHLNDLGVR